MSVFNCKWNYSSKNKVLLYNDTNKRILYSSSIQELSGIIIYNIFYYETLYDRIIPLLLLFLLLKSFHVLPLPQSLTSLSRIHSSVSSIQLCFLFMTMRLCSKRLLTSTSKFQNVTRAELSWLPPQLHAHF